VSEHTAENDAQALLYVAVRKHEVWGFNGSEIACRCDHRWRSMHDHADHHADALLASGARVIPPGVGA
jgi:hypothetical protein